MMLYDDLWIWLHIKLVIADYSKTTVERLRQANSSDDDSVLLCVINPFSTKARS